MSLRYEQYRSLLKTREFLRDLLTSKVRWTKKELKERAYSCLRHYPALTEKGRPMFSQDPFTED
jgi:hypothetical protein